MLWPGTSWSGRGDLNPRPPAPKAGALPLRHSPCAGASLPVAPLLGSPRRPPGDVVETGSVMTNTVLIAGASGLVGAAAVDKFLDDGWDVVAVSRRRPGGLLRPRRSATSRSTCATPTPRRPPSAGLGDVTHVVYTAVSTSCPGLVPGWSERDQMETNRDMLRNLMEPLAKAATLAARQPAAGHEGLRHPPPPDADPGPRALPARPARELLLAAGGLHPGEVGRRRLGLQHLAPAAHRRARTTAS